MGFQPAVTARAQDIHDLDYLIPVINLITHLVNGLIFGCDVRYIRKRNLFAALYSNHTGLRSWTVATYLILVRSGLLPAANLFRQQEIQVI